MPTIIVLTKAPKFKNIHNIEHPKDEKAAGKQSP